MDQFTYPTRPDDVVVQISVRAPRGPDTPLVTVYGDGTVIAATDDEWRVGTVSDLEIQRVLDEADSVGLLDGSLVLRGPDLATDETADPGAQTVTSGPDITIRFEVNGPSLVHELDLARIERPIGIRQFLFTTTARGRFELTDTFEPSAWIDCTSDECLVVDNQRDEFSRPVLPHEDPDDLVNP